MGADVNMAQYALLVGVGSFQNNLPNVDFVNQDVNALSEVLMSNMDVPFENIVVLINADATQTAIQSEVDSICDKANEGDRVILYFSTHGKTFGGTSFLAAYDASERKECNNGWIWISNLVTSLHNAKCNVLAFLDACHSTQFSRTHGSVAEMSPLTPISDVPGQYKAIFGAAGEHEEAYSDHDFCHGCWTYYLLEALSGNAPRAFDAGSKRITANSLQKYLFESVSTRQKQLGRKQTPYIDAVFPKDILIVEHHNMEDYEMKIKDIYFGSIDTVSEKRNAPSSEFIVKNFYDINSICSKLSANNGIQVIIGNKGTGKTYLGEFLEETNEKMVYQTVGSITLGDIQKLTLSQEEERGKYSQAWTFTLYTILACTIVREKKTGWEDFYRFLQEIYTNRTDNILHDFVAAKHIIMNKRIKNGVRLSDSYEDFRDENGLASIDDIISVYTFLFNTHYKSEKLFFLLDGLDEQIRGELKEKQRFYLLDLLEIVDQSHQILSGIRIILLFRNDILQKLSGEANINKIRSARSCTLSWLSNNTNYVDTPLYGFMEQRIATSAEAVGKERRIRLSDILPPQMQDTNTWEWILSFTTYTPRDIVSFFNCCKEFAGEQCWLTQENLWDATRPYSDYLWSEFQDILAGSSLAEHTEHLLNMFMKLVKKHNLDRNPKFTYSDFLEAYQEVIAFKDIPVSDSLKVLYESGIMCVHINSKTYWYFRENPMPFDFEIWKESYFELHKGLWKKVQIW